MLIEMLEILLTLKILGPHEIGGLGLKLFNLTVNPRLPVRYFRSAQVYLLLLIMGNIRGKGQGQIKGSRGPRPS